MKLLDKIIASNVDVYERSIDDIDYIVMDKDTILQLSKEYTELYGVTEPTVEEIQEMAGARILLPLIGKVNTQYEFLKRITESI